MHTNSSRHWIEHFERNSRTRRVNWDLVPAIMAHIAFHTPDETALRLAAVAGIVGG